MYQARIRETSCTHSSLESDTLASWIVPWYQQAARGRLWDTRFPLDAERAAEASGVRTTMTLTVDKDSETRRNVRARSQRSANRVLQTSFLNFHAVSRDLSRDYHSTLFLCRRDPTEYSNEEFAHWLRQRRMRNTERVFSSRQNNIDFELYKYIRSASDFYLIFVHLSIKKFTSKILWSAEI